MEKYGNQNKLKPKAEGNNADFSIDSNKNTKQFTFQLAVSCLIVSI